MSGRPLFQFCRVFFVGKKPAHGYFFVHQNADASQICRKVSTESECDGTTDELDTFDGWCLGPLQELNVSLPL